MEDLLRIFSNYQQDNWADWLPVVQYIINSRPSSTTKKAPFELWMGHILPAHQANRLMKIPQLWKRRQLLKEAHDQALKAMEVAQVKWVKPIGFKTYEPGDKVWLEAINLHTTHPTQKLRPK